VAVEPFDDRDFHQLALRPGQPALRRDAVFRFLQQSEIGTVLFQFGIDFIALAGQFGQFGFA
jgi:hypothetical protein